MRYTNEEMQKAREARSAEELRTLARESGRELTEEEATRYFDMCHMEGELSDDELGNVSGGGCGDSGGHDTNLWKNSVYFTGHVGAADVSTNVTYGFTCDNGVGWIIGKVTGLDYSGSCKDYKVSVTQAGGDFSYWVGQSKEIGSDDWTAYTSVYDCVNQKTLL